MDNNNKIKYTMIENGIEFIEEATKRILENEKLDREKLDSNQRYKKDKNIKHALINLSSGIELIFKHKLFLENWVYIFKDMNKASKKSFEKGDFISTDSKQNIDRLNNFCGIEIDKKDKEELEKLRNLRNKFEHFEIDKNSTYLEMVIRHGVKFSIKFITDFFNVDTFEDKLKISIEEIKNNLMYMDEYDKERRKLLERQYFKFDKYECPECYEKFFLSEKNEEYECKFCGFKYEENTKIKIVNCFNPLCIGDYLIIKENEIYCSFCYKSEYLNELGYCEECQENYLKFEEGELSGKCIICSKEYKNEDVVRCNCCGKVIDPISVETCIKCTTKLLEGPNYEKNLKTCPSCGEVKQLSEFNGDKCNNCD